jgi:hypothetical protein
VICPHCYQSLRYKQRRTGRRCSHCGRQFALEPNVSPLAMHDIRVRKLAEKLGDGRGLQYALRQLWYSAARTKVENSFRYAGIWTGVANPGERFDSIRDKINGTIILIIVGVVVIGVINRTLAFILGVAAFVAVQILLEKIKPVYTRTRRFPISRIPGTYLAFRKGVVERWSAVYGQLPPGAVDESAAIAPGSPRPGFVVLCPDRAVLACLAANYPAHGLEVAVADRIDRLPPTIPVIVLHDASVPGLLFAGQARAALGPRAVPAGLMPRAVLDKASSLRLCKQPPDPTELDKLARNLLLQTEIDWLAEGWWSPIAALPPARLIAMVKRAIERFEDATDPDRRRAYAIGFLTWPTP